MKKLVLFLAAMCSTLMANAEDFTVNGIKYFVTGTDPNTVEVIANEYSGDIMIPATVTNNDTEYSVTRIGGYAFSHCTLSSVSLPEGLQIIGEKAFYSCGITGLLTIPSTVTNIEKYAFHYCTLSSVSLPEGLQIIGESAFNASNITGTLTIPSTVTEIGMNAFIYCPLTSVILLEGQEGQIKTIGNSAFQQCGNLQSVSLLKGVQSIGTRAFSDCPKLQSVSLPEGLQRIEGYAFYITGITGELTIPASVTSIGESAFSNCSLTKVYMSSENLTDISNGIFNGSAMIVVPATLYEAYKSHFNGKNKVEVEPLSDWQEYTIAQIEAYMKTANTISDADKATIQSYYAQIRVAETFDAVADLYNAALALIGQQKTKEAGLKELLNDLGTKQAGPAIEIVDKNGQKIQLYNIGNVKFIKVNEEKE